MPTGVYERPINRQAITAQLEALRARRKRTMLQEQMCRDRRRELDYEIERLQAKLNVIVPDEHAG